MTFDQLNAALDALEGAGMPVRDLLDSVLAADSATPAPPPTTAGSQPSSHPKLSYDVHLADMLRDGRLDQAEKLLARYKGRTYEARLDPDGSVHVAGYGPAPTLSRAARLICRGERNGWRFWGVQRENRWVALADLRDAA